MIVNISAQLALIKVLKSGQYQQEKWKYASRVIKVLLIQLYFLVMIYLYFLVEMMNKL